MIWKIAKKDFLLNLMTFKFAVGTIVSVVLMAVFVPVLAKDYQQRLKEYNANVAANEAELRKVKAFKQIAPTVYRPPNVLSVFSEGQEKRIGNSAKIELESVPEISSGSEGVPTLDEWWFRIASSPGAANAYQSIFPTLDVSLIFRIVISLLALLVAYDVVSGERERGTLKLMMSGKAARYQVLLGKLVAGLMTLAVPVTIAFIVGLLVLQFFPTVDLDDSDWARIGLMYLASLIFVSAMYNIGILFSCLVRKSAISLVLALFFWIVCIIVIPNGSVCLARQIRPLELEGKLDGQRTLLRERFRDERRELTNGLPRGGVRDDCPGAFGRSFVAACSKPALERLKEWCPLGEPLKIKYADKFWQVERRYLDSLIKQKRLARNLSRTSPISVYENVMAALTGTGLAGSQNFMDRARTYRNKVIDYIRSKTENFSLPVYFTQFKGDWDEHKRELKSNEQYRQYEQAIEAAEQEGNRTQKQKLKWERWEWTNKWQIQRTPSLDLRDFPRFIYRPGAATGLQAAIPDIALSIFTNILFFTLSFVAFVRYDVR